MPRRPYIRNLLAGGAAALVLGAVFVMYWRPDMAFDVATKLWSCF